MITFQHFVHMHCANFHLLMRLPNLNRQNFFGSNLCGSASWRQLWYYSAFCFWHSTRVQIVVGLTWLSSWTGAQVVRAQSYLSYTEVNAIKLVINPFRTRPLGTFWMGSSGNWQSLICCQYCCFLSIWERSCLGFGLIILQSVMNSLKIVSFLLHFFCVCF